jgi:hypothetical protein
MSEIKDHTNMIHVLKRTLESDIRQKVAHDITETLVAEYRIAIGKQLTPMIKGITIKAINKMVDMTHAREDFEVYVKIAGEQKGFYEAVGHMTKPR